MFDYWRITVFRLRALLMLGLLASAGLCAYAERGLPAREGITNFGKIDEGVYRGAQPSALGITNLARLGIKSIINLRMTRDVWKDEERLALAHGILYTNLPLSGTGRPSDDQVRIALEMIQTLPGPVFIHCQHGCDRTGTIIACYRIQHDKWSNEAALQEAGRYGMSKLELGMRNFVLGFGKFSKQKPVAEEAR
jgi:protein tyrosine/serine phosphatase